MSSFLFLLMAYGLMLTAYSQLVTEFCSVPKPYIISLHSLVYGYKV